MSSPSNYKLIQTLIDTTSNEVVFTNVTTPSQEMIDQPRPFCKKNRMTAKEVMKKYNVSYNTLKSYRAQGRLVGYSIGRCTIYYVDDVEKALKDKGKWVKSLNQ